jgi:hypothetical protein
LGLFLLTVKGVTGLFIKVYTPAALFKALRLSEINFSPEPTLSAPDIPFTLPLVTTDKLKGGSVAVVETDLAACE